MSPKNNSNKNEWFKTLIGDGSLYDYYGQEFFMDKIILCHQKIYRSYGFVDSISELAKLIMDSDAELRCFFEVIPALKSCKPFFDLDINDPTDLDNHHLILKEVLYSITQISKENNWPLRDKDIIICESHSSSKKSYHITINSFHVLNIKFLKYLCSKLVSKVSDKYLKYVDLGIYNIHRQFRILMNTKYNQNRYKRWSKNNILKLANDGQSFEEALRKTLITNIEQSSIKIYIEEPEKIISYDELSKEMIDFCLSLLNDPNLEYNKVENNIICLKRKHSSYCSICHRQHDSENPYLIVLYDYVYYCCRRSEEKTLLGNLALYKHLKLETSEDQEPEPEEGLHLPKQKPEPRDISPTNLRNLVKEAISQE